MELEQRLRGGTPAWNQDRDCGEMNSSMKLGQRLWGDELQHGIRTEIVGK